MMLMISGKMSSVKLPKILKSLLMNVFIPLEQMLIYTRYHYFNNLMATSVTDNCVLTHLYIIYHT